VSEVELLLDEAADDFGPMLALACFAGLRVGQTCGLQLGDIDYLGRTIAVQRQAQRELGGGVEVRAPSTTPLASFTRRPS
jgi:integrase